MQYSHSVAQIKNQFSRSTKEADKRPFHSIWVNSEFRGQCQQQGAAVFPMVEQRCKVTQPLNIYFIIHFIRLSSAAGFNEHHQRWIEHFHTTSVIQLIRNTLIVIYVEFMEYISHSENFKRSNISIVFYCIVSRQFNSSCSQPPDDDITKQQHTSWRIYNMLN